MSKEFENLTVEEIGARIKEILSDRRTGLLITSTLFSSYYPQGTKTFCEEDPCCVVSFSLADSHPWDFDVCEHRIIMPNPMKIREGFKKKYDSVVRDNKAWIEKLAPKGAVSESNEYVESLKQFLEDEKKNFKLILDFIGDSFKEVNSLLIGEGFVKSKSLTKGKADTMEYERGI